MAVSVARSFGAVWLGCGTGDEATDVATDADELAVKGVCCLPCFVTEHPTTKSAVSRPIDIWYVVFNIRSPLSILPYHTEDEYSDGD